MTRYFMTDIKVEGFRGINNEGAPLHLKFSPETVNSVFAVNGYGKSSLFEALSYAIRGTVPKLEEMQAAERKDDYYINRFHSQSKATIQLEFMPDDGTANAVQVVVERDAQGNRTVTSPSNHPDPDEFLADLNEDFTLLDYKTFARFIDDTPLTRGRSFSALLGLSSYSDMRQSLQAAADTRSYNTDFETKNLAALHKTAVDAARQALAGVVSNYERVTGTPLSDVSDMPGAASSIVTALASVALLKPFLTDKKLGEIDFDGLKNAVREAEGGDRRKELEKALEDLGVFESLGAADEVQIALDKAALTQLLQHRDNLLAVTRGDLFKDLFDAAHAIVHEDSWSKESTCPLCDSDVKSPIRTYVDKQLEQYDGVAAQDKAIAEAWERSALAARLAKLEACALLQVPSGLLISRRLSGEAKSGKFSKESLDDSVNRQRELELSAKDKVKKLNEVKERLESELPQSLVQLTEQIEYGRQFQQFVRQYLLQSAEAAGLAARLNMRTRWKLFIDKAANTFAEAEGALAAAKIAAIDSEYKSTFRSIMNVHDVVPDLKRAGGSEDLFVQLSDFHGQPAASARALLSESYVNALAISVYLAAALKHAGAPRFLVLDDVTSSFDAGHQLALMEVIRQKLQQPSNPSGLQFFILSHDGLLEKYFDRLGNDGSWKHHRLQGSPPMGQVLGQFQDANRLRANLVALLTAGQISQAEPLIRQYLEFKLTQIIRKVGVPVPIDFAMKETNRMVSNCLDAITGAIDLHKRAGTLVLDVNQVQQLSTAHVPALLGNWCSHYETAAATSISGPMLLSVLQSIDDLSECFRYNDTAGAAPVRRWYRSLSAR